ncbi:MAG: potassium transporter Kup [Burkholderiales bacterium]|nr:MAG: potassium transporter Kup [Burkholderiales bacterium]
MSTATGHSHPQGGRSRFPLLVVGAIGVVFGDIGTSPLYALKEVFSSAHPMPLDEANLLGALSLIFWTLAVVVTAKYLVLIMRADNHGEGGILALLALVVRLTRRNRRLRYVLGLLGVFGATLFYGDAVITPAISVLSAVEGLEVIAPQLHPFVVPVSLTVLIGLFVIQAFGTGRVGAFFGPMTALWFLTIGVLGALSIVETPSVLAAVQPSYAYHFFADHPLISFIALGAVVLAVTGTEALYADMGHFGRGPIRVAWVCIVWPALLLNYFGQGALLLRQPAAVENPFYLLAPGWFLAPLVVLATCATVIASQAVISGAFSLTQQAIQLGLLPRMRIAHTSAREGGQIYISLVNWLLLIGVVFLVLEFRSSSGLAAAYGMAVTGAMMIDTLLVGAVMVLLWRWPRPLAAAIVGVLLLIDMTFFAANALKFLAGGWLPLLIALALFTVLTTWRRGRQLLIARKKQRAVGRDDFIRLMADDVPRVPGTAVFLTGDREIIPGALLHNLKHNKVLHERIVFLTVKVEDVPYVADAECAEIKDLGKNFYRVLLRYGFMQQPDIPRGLELCGKVGLPFEMMETTFVLGRDTVIPTREPGMALWREHIFAWMTRNAATARDFFRIPAGRVIELGSQIEI